MKRKDKNKMLLPPKQFHKWLQELLKQHNEKIEAGRTSYIGELALLATVIYYEKHPDYLDARENQLERITEQKLEYAHRYHANRIAKMTEKELQEFREKRRVYRRRTIATMTPEQLQEYRKSERDRYHRTIANMTPEELQAFREHKRKVTIEYQRTHREKCNAKVRRCYYKQKSKKQGQDIISNNNQKSISDLLHYLLQNDRTNIGR